MALQRDSIHHFAVVILIEANPANQLRLVHLSHHLQGCFLHPRGGAGFLPQYFGSGLFAWPFEGRLGG